MQKDNGTTETIYANSLYEEKGATTTKHIYANDMLVATVEEDTPAPKVYYNHLDHLNSTNAVTSDDGYINQLLAYYPFGDGRIDEQYTSIDQTSRYTGYKHDEETGLSYAGARYQSGEQGRFVSQDPVALAIGNQPLMDSMTNMDLTAYLRKPQLHNSYSYAGNNPIKYIDKNGEFVFLAVPAAVYVAAEIGFTAYDVYDMVKTLSDANSSNVDRSLSVGGVALGLVLPGGGYGAGAKVTKNLTTGSLRTASNVNVTEKGFNHVLSRHTINGAEFTAGNTSYFNNADEIGDLIKSVNGQKGVVQPNGNIARTIQLDKNIGYDAVTKSDTNVMTVVTKQNGDLVTAHPGSPRKSPKTEN